MIERWEQAYVDELMHHTRGNLSRAAIAAGMNRTHLQRVLQRHGERRC